MQCKEKNLLGSIVMKSDEVIRLAEAKINFIMDERAKYTKRAAELKKEHISEFRRRWNRWFNSNLSDEELWKKMTSCCVMYLDNTSNVYREAERRAEFGYENQLANCKRILSLAKKSTDGLVQITDEGLSNLR